MRAFKESYDEPASLSCNSILAPQVAKQILQS